MRLIYQSRYQHLPLKQMAHTNAEEVEGRAALSSFVQRFIMIRFEMFKPLRVKVGKFWCRRVIDGKKSRLGHLVWCLRFNSTGYWDTSNALSLCLRLCSGFWLKPTANKSACRLVSWNWSPSSCEQVSPASLCKPHQFKTQPRIVWWQFQLCRVFSSFFLVKLVVGGVYGRPENHLCEFQLGFVSRYRA